MSRITTDMPGGPENGLWDRRVETLSAEELHATVELPLLRRQLAHAWRNSPFWRDRLRTAGIAPADLNGRLRPADLPFLEKHEVLQDQIDHPPFGRLLAVPREALRRMHRTSGTKSRPLLTVLTQADIEATLEAGARAFWCAGVRPDDTVVHCLNYCLWSGGLTDHLCLERTGAMVMPYGVGNSRYLLDVIRHVRPTAISCTPSYLDVLAGLARDELGIEPRDLGLRKGLFGGEPGIQNAHFRAAVEAEWGMDAIDANYGLSDVLSVFGSECPCRDGLHFHGQGFLLPELIDPATLASLPIRDGAVGELVVTHLAREAQPLLRFRTRDMVSIRGAGPCACGRTSFRFVVLGRSDDMLVIKGVNVFPNAFRDVLARFPGELTGAYRVLLDDVEPRQSVTLQAEVRSGVSDSRRSSLRTEVESLIRNVLSVRAEIIWVREASLGRTDGKTSLVKRADVRDHADAADRRELPACVPQEN